MKIRCFKWFLPLLAVAALFAGCSDSHHDERDGDGHGPQRGDPAEGVVSEAVEWPNLRKLDELAVKAEGYAEDNRLQALREIAPELKSFAFAVSGDPVPAGAANPARVAALQDDLRSLAEALDDPASALATELNALAHGAHPIVEELMEAAGMPHLHDHDHSH